MLNLINSYSQLGYKFNGNLLVLQVGDSDQKLADGISLYSIGSDTYEKGAIIGTLVSVRLHILSFLFQFHS